MTRGLDSKNKRRAIGVGILGGMVGGQVLNTGARIGAEASVKAVSAEEAQRFADVALAREGLTNVPVHFSESLPSRFAPNTMRYDHLPSGWGISSRPSWGIGTLAHEIGHAKNFEKGFLNQTLRSGIYGVSTQLSKLSPLLAPLGMAVAMRSDDPRAQNAALVAPTALALPMLYEEGAATARGFRMIAQQKGFLRAAREAIPLAFAHGTYMSLPAAGVIGALITRKLMEQKHGR